VAENIGAAAVLASSRSCTRAGRRGWCCWAGATPSRAVPPGILMRAWTCWRRRCACTVRRSGRGARQGGSRRLVRIGPVVADR